MARYSVNNNTQSNGDHEVHELGCSFMPTDNRTYLGEFSSCRPAVTEAKKHHNQVNGCHYRARDCHTQQSHSTHRFHADLKELRDLSKATPHGD